MRSGGGRILINSHAVIDPKAEIASNVTIGAFSVVGPEVRIDSGTTVGPHVVIKGPASIGQDNHIYQFASIGEDPQDKKYSGEKTSLEIGDRNTIREFCTLHRGTAQDKVVTRIGNENLFMAYSHVAHDCVIGHNVIMANAASLAGHVHLDDNVILGGFTLVHQFSKIGQYSFSAMGSILTRDVPPYIMTGGQPTQAHGINSVGLERQGFSPESIRQIRKAYKILYKSGLKLKGAITELKTLSQEATEIKCMVTFLENVERGILR